MKTELQLQYNRKLLKTEAGIVTLQSVLCIASLSLYVTETSWGSYLLNLAINK